MTVRRRLILLSAFIVGFWPAGLLVGGLDFYRVPGELPLAFLLGLAAPDAASRRWWPAAAGAGLTTAFASLLLVVGTEWRFIAFAFARALPFFVAAAAGALTRVAVERVRERTRTVRQA